MGAFKRGGGGGERRGEGVGRLIEGGGVGRPAGKNLQILDLHRLASLLYRDSGELETLKETSFETCNCQLNKNCTGKDNGGICVYLLTSQT